MIRSERILVDYATQPKVLPSSAFSFAVCDWLHKIQKNASVLEASLQYIYPE